MTRAATLMAGEIAEQPSVLARLLKAAPEITAVAGEIAAANPRFVMLAARGTSDHAALYCKYLIEIVLGLPAGLASPSTMTAYGSRPNLSDVLVIGVSQSGGSPDLLEALGVARECGASTLSITNTPDSEMAGATHWHVDVLAGPERAVAATKTYTAELMACWLLVNAWNGETSMRHGYCRISRRISWTAGPRSPISPQDTVSPIGW